MRIGADVLGLGAGLEGAAARVGQLPRAAPSRGGGLPQARPAADPSFDVAGMERAFRGGQRARSRVDGWLGAGDATAGVEPGAAIPASVVTREPLADLPIAMELGAPVQRFARGGLADTVKAPRAARRVGRMGLVHATSPGRADLVGTKLPRGSYVLPADVVSGVGEGNTMAGAKLLGMSLPELAKAAAAGSVHLAGGGRVDEEELDVRLSGGEFLVAPEQVRFIGGGDAEAGAAALDRLVAAVRGAVVEHSVTSPGPV